MIFENLIDKARIRGGLVGVFFQLFVQALDEKVNPSWVAVSVLYYNLCLYH